MEASHKKHRHHIKVGEDAEQEEDMFTNCISIQTVRKHTASVTVLHISSKLLFHLK